MWLTITKRRRVILNFINKCIVDRKYPPTIREIGQAAGIKSTSVVSYNLQRLCDAGLIDKMEGTLRGITLNSIPDSDFVVMLKTTDYKKRRSTDKISINVNNYFDACAYCGKQNDVLHRDHFVPVAKGGKDKPNNMLPACQKCNLSKNDKEPAKWVIDNFGIDRLAFILKYLCSV